MRFDFFDRFDMIFLMPLPPDFELPSLLDSLLIRLGDRSVESMDERGCNVSSRLLVEPFRALFIWNTFLIPLEDDNDEVCDKGASIAIQR